MMLVNEELSKYAGSGADLRSSELQEHIWVLQAQGGDERAFGHLVERFDRRLLYYLMRLAARPDQAWDVAQDVWLTAWRRLKKLRSPRAFRVWLYRIAHDRLVNVIRSEVRREAVHELWREQQGDNMEDDATIRMNAESVHRALAALAPQHREVLILHFLEDMSLNEIAEALGCKPGTVKSRLHYAKQALRSPLEKRYE